MKNEDITGKTPDELKVMLLDLRKKQLNLRFQKTGGQLADLSQVRKLRRQIARVKTALNAPEAQKKAPKTAPKAKKTTKKTASKKAA